MWKICLTLVAKPKLWAELDLYLYSLLVTDAVGRYFSVAPLHFLLHCQKNVLLVYRLWQGCAMLVWWTHTHEIERCDYEHGMYSSEFVQRKEVQCDEVCSADCRCLFNHRRQDAHRDVSGNSISFLQVENCFFCLSLKIIKKNRLILQILWMLEYIREGNCINIHIYLLVLNHDWREKGVNNAF